MKAIRIFYGIDGKILGNCGLEGLSEFPYSAEIQLKEFPSGTECLEIDNPEAIDFFLHSEGNYIKDSALVIGTPIISPPPKPPRDLAAEIDALKAKLTEKGILL